MQPHHLKEPTMNSRMPIVLFALLALAQSFFLLPAAADSNSPINHPPPAVVQPDAIAPQACPAPLKGAKLTQVTSMECCKAHKGLCGCRAGKLVCCDGTVSNEPGCTCHGDNGFPE
jgi:hypothetical protein